MKAIIFVLLGLVALSSATHLKSQLKAITRDELTADEQDSLDWGIDQVIAEAQKAKKVDAEDVWVISSIEYGTETADGARAVNHNFKVTLTDNNDSVLTATFTVHYVAFSKYRSLENYDYKVTNTRVIAPPTATGAWEDIEIEGDAQDVFRWAVQTIIDAGASVNKIPTESYTLMDADLQTQTMTRGTNFKGYADLHNGRTTEVIINFTVYVDPNGKRTLTKSNFKATGIQYTATFDGSATITW